jgi:hypothetical protein
MFTVTSQPFRRHRHAVVSEIPACFVNVRRLKIGLPVSGANSVVFSIINMVTSATLPWFTHTRQQCLSNPGRPGLLGGSRRFFNLFDLGRQQPTIQPCSP